MRKPVARRTSLWSRFLFLFAMVGALLTAGSAATAATYYWDSDGNATGNTVTGVGLGGTGNWATSSTNWWLSGGTADVVWPTNDTTDTAWFGGASGTVTLTANQSAAAFVFSSTGYTVTGNTLNLINVPSSTLSYSGTGNAATIASALNIGANSFTAALAPANSLTISGKLIGTGTYSQTGGAVTLSGSNTGFTGAVVVATSGATSGDLILSNSAALGGISSITLNNLAALGGNTNGGNGTEVDATAFTGGQTIVAALNFNTDPTLTTLRTDMLFKPSSGSLVTMTGAISVSGSGNAQLNNAGAGTVVINGNTTGAVGTYFIRGGGPFTMNGAVSILGSLAVTDSTTMTINSPGNWGLGNIANGGFTMGGANILPSTSTTELGQNTTGQFATLTLNGFSQTTAQLLLNNNTSTNSVTSTTSAVLNVLSGGIVMSADTANNLTIGGAATVATPLVKYTTGATGTTISGNALWMSGGTIDASALATSGTNTISANIVGNAGLTIKANGDVSDTGGGAAGYLAITGAGNTFTGGVNIVSGLVNPGASDAPLGPASNVITLSGGGGLFATTNATYSAARTIQIAPGNVGTFRQSSGDTMTVNSLITGLGVLHKTDGGTLVLTNANTYSNGTTVGAGNLQVSNTAGSATGSGNVTINNGATVSSGSGAVGFISGSLQPAATAYITPGNTSYGTMTIGGLVSSGTNTNLNFNLTSPAGPNSQLVVNANTLDFTNGATVNFNTPVAPFNLAVGSYPLINVASTSLVNGGNLSFGGGILPRQASQYSLVTGPTYISLNVASVAAQTFNFNTYASPASWAAAGNWDLGMSPGVQGDNVTFGVLTTAGSVTLDSNPHVGTLNINQSFGGFVLSGGSYATSGGNVGGTLVMDNTGPVAYINNQNGSNIISAPVALLTPTTSVTVSNEGQLLFSGAVSGTGGLSVQSGSGPVVLTANATYTGPTSIASGGTLQLGNVTQSPTMATPSIADSGTLFFNINNTSTTFAPSISGTGNLMLVGNDVSNPPNITLTGTNTFSGGANITGARLIVASPLNLGSGPVTVNSTGEVYISGAGTYNNSFTLTGLGALESAGQLGAMRVEANAIIAGPVNLVNGQTQITDYNGPGGVITGLVTGDAASQLVMGRGTMTLTNANNSLPAGITFLPTNGVYGMLISANPGAIGTGTVTLANGGGTLGLYADGNGLGTQDVAGSYSNPIVVSGGSAVIAVGRTGQGIPYGSLMFTQAANKIVDLTSPISLTNANNLLIANNNGYGLDMTAGAAFTYGGTLSVTNATTSNVTQGLIIDGPVSSDVNGFAKAGAGTLVLTNAGNTISGPITIAQGVLSLDANGAAETGNQNIILSPVTGTSTLRATGNLTLGNNVVTLATASNTSAIEVVTGATLNLGSLNLTAPTAGLVKNDNGTLVLTGVNTGWTGPLTVNAGVVQISNAASLPTGVLGVGTANGAAFQLSSNVTISNPINLDVPASNPLYPGGINGMGGFESVSGVNTLSGTITYNQDSGVGADTGSTLNLTGGIPVSVGHRLSLNGGGTINITGGSITSVYAIDKFGTGTTNIQVNVGGFNNAAGLNVDSGLLVFSGAAGKLTVSGGNNNINVQAGATLQVDDSQSSPVANRLASNVVNLYGGTLNYVANGTSASSEAIGNFDWGGGGNTLMITNGGAAAATLSTLSMTSTAGGSILNIVTSGGTLGSSTNNLVISNTAAGSLYLSPTGNGIISRVAVGGTSFATLSSSTSGSIIPYTAYDNSNSFNSATVTGTDTVNLSAAPAWNYNYNQAINALLLQGGVTLNGPVRGATLTPTTGNILVPSGSAVIGSNTVLALAGVENGLMVNTGATLNVQGPITGIYNLNKGLGGTLIFSAPVYDTSTSNWLYVNGGTVQLNAGNATMMSGLNLWVQAGATLDLNGNGQIFQSLTNANNAEPFTQGTITSSNGNATLVVANATNEFFGNITGPVALVKTGANTLTLGAADNYTGPTEIIGSALTIADQGALTGTPRIDINYGTLNLSDNGSFNYSGNVARTGTATVNLRGGVLTYAGRSQTISSQTISAVNLVQGESFINMSANGTGVNSATLNFNSFSQGGNATVNFSTVAGAAGVSGQIANSTTQLFINGFSNTDNIMGGWAIELRDFASYVPGLGVGQLNSVGFPGYSANTLSSSNLATDNVKITAGPAAPMTGNVTLNSLNVSYTASPTVDLGGNSLDVISGGLMFATGTDGTVAKLQNGTVTAGNGTGPASLYLYFLPYSDSATVRTANVTASIANNAGNPVTLVYNGSDYTNNLLTLNGTNTYTGGTVVNAGMLVLGASGTLPAGGITINGSPANGGNTGLTQAFGGMIAPQALTLNGAASLTLGGTLSATSLTINNNGGTTAPTISGGTLYAPANGITVTSNNVSTVAAISSTLDFGNAAPTLNVSAVTLNGQALAPLVPSLNISGVIRNAGNLTWTGGGNLELSGQSIFAGGVTAPSGAGLVLGGNSTPSAALTFPTSGPLGSGTLTINSGANILAAAASTVSNAVTVGGNFNFAGVTAVTLNGPITLPSNTTTAINVAAPQMIATLGGNLNGANAVLSKTGYGNLVLGGVMSSLGAATVNGGALTLAGQNTANPQPLAFGGTVTLNNGILQLANNGAQPNSLIYLNDNVVVNNASQGFISVNNNGANTGSTFVLPNLTYSGLSSNATVLSVTGANGYNLKVNNTNLNNYASPVTFNIAAGVTVTLPGVFGASNTPLNVGPGTLLFAGANAGSLAYSVTGTKQINPAANASGYQFGTNGAIQLGAGSTLQVMPEFNSSTPLSNSGYTSGGLAGKYYSESAASAIFSAQTSGVLPSAVLPSQQPADASLAIRPVVVANNTSFSTDMAIYNGLLNINTAGTYIFQSGADDAMQMTIDGSTLIQQLYNSTGGQSMQVSPPTAIYLTSGMHEISFKAFNNGGNGGDLLFYAGPDTGANNLQTTGGNTAALQPILPSNLYSTSAVGSAANNYLNAAQVSNAVSLAANTSSTIDGIGTDMNSTFASLAISGGSAAGASVLTVNNVGGQGFVGIVGTTTISGANATVSPATGTLYLVGGINDSGFGLTKTGSGTLILGNSPGTFTGALTVSTGYLQVAGAGALPTAMTTIASGAMFDLNGISNVAGNVTINGTGPAGYMTRASAALYNTSVNPASMTGTLFIGANGSAVGGYGNINLASVNDGGHTWTKVGPDMLTLSGVNSSATGILSVTNGIVQLANAGALGTTAGSGLSINAASGGAIDLDGQTLSGGGTLSVTGVGIANNLGVSTSGGYGFYNSSLAALYNSSASPASFSGVVALTGGASIGGTSLVPGVTTGNISLNGTITGNQTLTKVGNNTLYMTLATTDTGNFIVNGGALAMNGTFAQPVSTGVDYVNAGTLLALDNSVTQTNNRLGGHGFINTGGTLYINAGPANSSVLETISTTGNNLNVGGNGNGEGVYTLDAGNGGSVQINVASTNATLITVANQATGLFRGTNLGQASVGTNGYANITATGATSSGVSTTNGQVVGQTALPGSANALIYPAILADTSATGNGIGFATYDVNGIRPLNIPGSGDGVQNAFTTTDNVLANNNTVLTTAASSGLNQINSLTIDASTGGSVVISPNSTVQLQSGGLLALGGATSITGAGVLSTTANAQLYIHTPNPDAGGTTVLNIGVPILGTTGPVTKADGGTAIFSVPQLYTGVTTIDSGTLKLAGGNQTIFQIFETPPSAGNTGTGLQGNVFSVNNSGVLDLNGNNQVVQVLTSGAGNGGPAQYSGGTITNSSATPATFRIMPNSNQTWSGNMSGNLNFVRDGYSVMTFNTPQTYTGATVYIGGQNNLVDYATLNSSAIDIRHSSLLWDNSGITALSNRLTNVNGLIPITLDGGSFRFNARGGAADVANLGTVNLDTGSNRIDVQNNNGSATLNISGITRNIGTSLTFVAGLGAGNNNGAIGVNPYIVLGSTPTLTNSMIGAWAVVVGMDTGQGATTTDAAFASYVPGVGIIGIQNLNQVAGGSNVSNVYQGNTFGAGQNTHLIGNATLPGTLGVTSTTSANSLTMTTNAVTLSYVNPTDTLVLQSGGLLAGTDGNNRTVGAFPGQGNLTTSPGQQELFLHNGANTLAVNANIVDNGAPLAVVVDTLAIQGPVITLAGNNTYTGTTYVNGGIVNLSSTGGLAISGTNVIVTNNTNNGSDSGSNGDTTITLQASNQINPQANLTLMGGAEYIGNSFNQTLANVTITNDGSTNGGNATAVLTGSGILTVSGVVSASGTGNTISSYDIPTINGQLRMTAAAPTIYVDPSNVPNQVALELNSAVTLASTAALNKTGLGVLGIGGMSQFSNGLNIGQGGVAFGANNAFLGNSRVTINAGTFFDTRGDSGTIGSLTGSGTLQNLATANGTLVTGWDNTNSTFSGAMINPIPQYQLSLTKIGSGAYTLTADNRGANLNSPNLGTLTVQQGSVSLSGAGAVGFSTYTLVNGGSLILNNSTAPVSNRLGSSFLYVSPTVANATTNRTLNLEGGKLALLGNTGTAVTENLGTVNVGNGLGGGSVLTLPAAGSAGVNVVINAIANQNGYGMLLVAGDNLGQSAGGGVATVTVTNTPNYPGLVAQGGGADGNPLMSIRPDIIADTSSAGTGIGFATVDPSTGLLRPILAANGELVTSSSALNSTTNTTNAGFTTAQMVAFSTNVNSLTLSGNGSIASPGGVGGSTAQLTLNSGGLLATSGTTAISVGSLTAGGISMDIHVAGAKTVLDLNSPIVNETSGIVKGDAGTLYVNVPQLYSGGQGMQINGGKVVLNGGAFTLPIIPGAGAPTVYTLGLNGGTLDLNGASEAVGSLVSVNNAPGMGGTLTNSGFTPANLIVYPSAAASFGGTITDNPSGTISLYKVGGNNLTLTAPQTYEGSTTVMAGTLSLTGYGQLVNTSVVNSNYSYMSLDNSGLAAVANRLGNAVVNMNGSQTSITARPGNDAVSLAGINVVQGNQILTLNLYNTNQQTGALNVTVGSLSQANNATINFVANSGTFGATGDNARLFISSYNANPPLTNGMLGGWAVVNAADFAGYVPSQGIGALGTTGFPAYATDALTAGVATDNISVTATVGPVTSRTINSLAIRAPAAATTVTMNSLNDTLTIGTGGLLINDSGNHGVTIAGGNLSAGATLNTPASLYIYESANTSTIDSTIVNNASAPVTLVKAGAGTTTLAALAVTPGSASSGATTVTVNGASGLVVGDTITSGVYWSSAPTITAISGNVLTLSVATTAAIAANTNLTFAPPAAQATENLGSSTLSYQGSAFTPTVGMTIGGTGIPSGTYITAVSGGTASGWSIVMNNAATQTAAPTLTFGALSNSYAGGTVVNQGTLNLSGQPGAVLIPGNLTIQGNGTVTENNNSGQIATTSNVVFNGSGVLNLTGTGNVLSSVTFADNGGLNPSSLAAATGLAITSAAAITSNNDDFGAVPAINGTSISLNSTSPTITTTGLAPTDLVISAPITSVGGFLIKTGTGSVALTTNASTFSYSVKLNQGTIILGAPSVSGSAGVSATSGPVGTQTLLTANNTSLMSAGQPEALANGVTVTGNLNLGGAAAGNGVSLTGPVTLNSGASITVPNSQGMATIGGTLTVNGAQGIVKNGPGTLLLGGQVNNSGPVTINGGTLKLSYAGLFEGQLLNGGTNTTDPTDTAPYTSVQLTTRYANSTSTAPWPNYSTWVYTGYLVNSTSAAETVSFGKDFDDGTLLTLGAGSVAINNDADATVVYSSVYTLPANSKTPFQLRLYQGTGNVGPRNDGTWAPTSLGVGIFYGATTATSTVSSNYVALTDPGNGSLFTTAVNPPVSTTTPVVMANNTTLDIGSNTFTIGSLSDQTPGASTGAMVLLGSGGLNIGGNNTSTMFSGALIGVGGSLDKIGNGMLTLAGSLSSYSGATTVNSGTLQAGVANALSPNSSVTVNNSATLDVTGGSQTIAGLAFTGAGALNLNLNGVLSSTGAANFNTGTTLNLVGIVSTLPETLMTYAGFVGGFTNVNYYGLSVPLSDLAYQYGSLQLISSVAPAWASPVSGSWNNGGNWTSNPTVPGAVGESVVINASTAGPLTITLDGPQTVGSLLLGAGGLGGGYTITSGSVAGAALTFSNFGNGAVINVTDGQHTIAAPVVLDDKLSITPSSSASLLISGNISDDGNGRSLTLNSPDGTGELILTGTNSYGGGTIVDAGTLIAASPAALPAGSSLIVGQGASSLFGPAASLPTAGPAVAATPVAGPALAAVPEPGTLMLVLAGMVFGLGILWKRKRS